MPTVKNRTLPIIFAVLLLSLVGCLDPIELKIPKGFDETLIIQGALIKGTPSTMELTVTRLFDFTPESLTRVNVSEVILTDEAGNSVEVDRVGTGTYRSTFVDGQSAVDIEQGKSYKVNIRTFDGRTYESTLEPMVPVPSIDSLLVEGITKEFVFDDGETLRQDSFARIKVNTNTVLPNTQQAVALKWDMRRTFKLTDTPIEFGVEQKTCFVTDLAGVTEVRVFNGANVNGEPLDNYILFDQSFDYHLSEGLYFEVVQSSLSPGAFEYFDQVRQVLDREGNMFEAPAGKIVTNFVNTQDPEEEVFGYFYASITDTARIYISPEFARFPTRLCPPPMLVTPAGDCALLDCCDCLSLEFSTTIQPDFWQE